MRFHSLPRVVLPLSSCHWHKQALPLIELKAGLECQKRGPSGYLLGSANMPRPLSIPASGQAPRVSLHCAFAHTVPCLHAFPHPPLPFLSLPFLPLLHSPNELLYNSAPCPLLCRSSSPPSNARDPCTVSIAPWHRCSLLVTPTPWHRSSCQGYCLPAFFSFSFLPFHKYFVRSCVSQAQAWGWDTAVRVGTCPALVSLTSQWGTTNE